MTSTSSRHSRHKIEAQADHNPRPWPGPHHEAGQPPSGDEEVLSIDNKRPDHGGAPVVESSEPVPDTGGNGTGGTARDVSTSATGQLLGPGSRERTAPDNATIRTGSLFHKILKSPAVPVDSGAAALGPIRGHISGDILDSVNGEVCGGIGGTIVVSINGCISIKLRGLISAGTWDKKLEHRLLLYWNPGNRLISEIKPKRTFMSRIKAKIKGDVDGHIHGNIHHTTFYNGKPLLYGEIQGYIEDKIDAKTHLVIQGDIYGDFDFGDFVGRRHKFQAEGYLVFEEIKSKVSGFIGGNLDQSLSGRHSKHLEGSTSPKTGIDINATIVEKDHKIAYDRLSQPVSPGPVDGEAHNAEPCSAKEVSGEPQAFEPAIYATDGETGDIDMHADDLGRANLGRKMHTSPRTVIEGHGLAEAQASIPTSGAEEFLVSKPRSITPQQKGGLKVRRRLSWRIQ